MVATAPARVTRIVIEHRESPAYRGQSFGEAGPYEWLRGRAYGELDPKAPLNAIITDIEFAPRNARGMVEYSATFTLAKPVDLSKASGVLLYDVANRGRIALAASSTDAGALADLFKRGHVVLSSGWQGDVIPREGIESITVPLAKMKVLTELERLLATQTRVLPACTAACTGPIATLMNSRVESPETSTCMLVPG